MIHLGMPTLIETDTLEQCAELCQDLGLQFVELNMNLPQYQPNRMDISRLREIAGLHEIYFTIHLDENLNVSDFNPYVAGAYRRTVQESIAVAKALGMPVLNMHMADGVYFTLPERKVYLFKEYRETYLKSMETFRDECEAAIGDADIKLCIENSSGYRDFQREAITLLLESPVFGLTLDIGHNHCAGGKDEAFVLTRAERLCHMHMHDALGTKDHLALGVGELDLKRYVALAREHACRIVLETKTIAGLRESVGYFSRQLACEL